MHTGPLDTALIIAPPTNRARAFFVWEAAHGEQSVSARELEGIVPKWQDARYETDGVSTSCLKIQTPEYSQMTGRWELFERWRDRRGRDLAATASENRLLTSPAISEPPRPELDHRYRVRSASMTLACVWCNSEHLQPVGHLATGSRATISLSAV